VAARAETSRAPNEKSAGEFAHPRRAEFRSKKLPLEVVALKLLL
jgi:hypothetical protein